MTDKSNLESLNDNKLSKEKLMQLMGAAFLMATSAVGPGFLTQTTVFTEELGATFGFVILASVIISAITQLNIWRIIAVSKMKGQEIANKIVPGLGNVLGILIALGGLTFTIGNMGGGAMGLNAIFGIDMRLGSMLFCAMGIFAYLFKDSQKFIDKAVTFLGAIMILIMVYIVFASKPPIGEAAYRTFVPESLPLMPIMTMVGGIVGGFISFAGAHRFIDAGISGRERLPEIDRSAHMAITITAVMRVLLFLAILGVVTQGNSLDPNNPTADAFRLAAGDIGGRFFGIVMWAAGLSSIIGCSYTSISFLTDISDTFKVNASKWCIGFLLVAEIIFLVVGNPTKLLVLAGTVNAFILPLSLGILLIASRRTDIIGEYKHSKLLFISGIMVVLITLYMGTQSLDGIRALFA